MDKGTVLLNVLKELQKEKGTDMEAPTTGKTKGNKSQVTRKTAAGMEKKCSSCRQYKLADHDHFNPDGRGHLKLSATCKECLAKKQKKGARKPLPAVPFPGTATQADDEYKLILDFSSDLDLLSTLLATAEKNRRRPDQQVLWQLEQQLVEPAA